MMLAEIIGNAKADTGFRHAGGYELSHRPETLKPTPIYFLPQLVASGQARSA